MQFDSCCLTDHTVRDRLPFRRQPAVDCHANWHPISPPANEANIRFTFSFLLVISQSEHQSQFEFKSEHEAPVRIISGLWIISRLQFAINCLIGPTRAVTTDLLMDCKDNKNQFIGENYSNERNSHFDNF